MNTLREGWHFIYHRQQLVALQRHIVSFLALIYPEELPQGTVRQTKYSKTLGIENVKHTKAEFVESETLIIG